MKLALIGDRALCAGIYSPGSRYQGRACRNPGAIYGEGYHELESHCFAYIHATTVGGTHPALIEAMGRGRWCCIEIRRRMRRWRSRRVFPLKPANWRRNCGRSWR